MAALHYVLGDAFDRNPFLLFELRGRSKESVLTALRRLRAGSSAAGRSRTTPRRSGRAGVRLERMSPERYEAFREPVDDLRFHIAAPAVEGAVLRQLGVAPGWSLPLSPSEVLQPAVTRAARLARELALGQRAADDTQGQGA